MKKFKTFAQWAADQLAGQKKMISAIRKLVNKTAPTLVESVKWGNGVEESLLQFPLLER